MTPQNILGYIVVAGLGFCVLMFIWMWVRHRMYVIREKRKCPLAPHDYPVNKGGDGTPSHFHKYTCWKCGEEFYI